MVSRNIKSRKDKLLREDLRNKNIITKIMIENIKNLNKKVITRSFSYNENVTKDLNKDVDLKFSGYK